MRHSTVELLCALTAVWTWSINLIASFSNICIYFRWISTVLTSNYFHRVKNFWMKPVDRSTNFMNKPEGLETYPIWSSNPELRLRSCQAQVDSRTLKPRTPFELWAEKGTYPSCCILSPAILKKKHSDVPTVPARAANRNPKISDGSPKSDVSPVNMSSSAAILVAIKSNGK